MRLPRDYILHIESARNGVQLIAEWQGEVVRCKECKEWNEYARDKLGRCDCHLITTSADDFCSYGERSEE